MSLLYWIDGQDVGADWGQSTYGNDYWADGQAVAYGHVVTTYLPTVTIGAQVGVTAVAHITVTYSASAGATAGCLLSRTIWNLSITVGATAGAARQSQLDAKNSLALAAAAGC